ncbi:hypothetical protein VE03_06145 [Pseudogymnoascus sp. 23342-1-I1]|nr:hypothetical protein VE03_06145 [Pseudogymnoascus sp. 23342-1-I1]
MSAFAIFADLPVQVRLGARQSPNTTGAAPTIYWAPLLIYAWIACPVRMELDERLAGFAFVAALHPVVIAIDGIYKRINGTDGLPFDAVITQATQRPRKSASAETRP